MTSSPASSRNDDLPARGSLIVTKVVVTDDGANATPDDFAFVVSGVVHTFVPTGTNVVTVVPGVYTVTEIAAPGFTTTLGNCANVLVPAGGVATCTIVNDDIGTVTTQLVVVKVVVNDNGGTATVADFGFQVNGGSAQPFGASGVVVLAVGPGTYTVTEPAAAGYTTTYAGCTDVVLVAGQTIVCTITNDDVLVPPPPPATLIVTKVVVNDAGGTKVASDFTFVVNGVEYTFDADGSITLSVLPGTYTITEPAVAGYTAAFDNCTGVIVASGATATCTITNSDDPVAPPAPATLVIVKVVVNDNGGTSAAGRLRLFRQRRCGRCVRPEWHHGAPTGARHVLGQRARRRWVTRRRTPAAQTSCWWRARRPSARSRTTTSPFRRLRQGRW